MYFSDFKIKTFLPFCILSLLVAFYIANNFIWFSLDTIPAFNDSAYHLSNYRVFEHILDGSFSAQELSYFEDMLYPPFYYYFAALVSWVLGGANFSWVLANVLFYAILLVAVYSIGKKIFGAREGISACIILSFYPYLYGATRIFIIEIALCSLATLCLCFLLYSEELRSTRFTVAAAMVCFLGMLTKQSFLIYIIGPLAFTIVRAMIRRNALKKVFFLISAGVAVPILFILLLLPEGAAQLFQMHFETAGLYTSGGYWLNLFYYFRILPDQINWLSFIFFMVGMTGYILTETKNKSFVIIWLLTPLFILMVAPLKTSKYSLPCLPAVALISSWCLYAVAKPMVRYVLLTTILIFGVFVHYMLFFDVPFSISPFTREPMSFNLTPYAEYIHQPRREPLNQVQNALFKVLQENIHSPKIHRIGVTDYSLSPDDLFNPKDVIATDSFLVVNERGMTDFILQHRLPFIAKNIPNASDFCRKARDAKLDFLVAALPLDDFFPQWKRCYKQAALIVVPSDQSRIYVYVRK